MVKLRELQQKSDALTALYQGFLACHEEASQQQSFPIAKARVSSEAVEPRQPSSPRKGLVLGLRTGLSHTSELDLGPGHAQPAHRGAQGL